MDEKLKLPDFKDEAEEARWWFGNRDSLDQQFIQGRRRGQAGPGHGRAPGWDSDDHDPSRSGGHRAGRVQAERRGLKYQTYLKMLIHEALEREGAKSAS